MEKSQLQIALENIKDTCDGYGFDEMQIHSYSGRGMYGRECLAITGKIDLLNLGFLIASEGHTELESIPPYSTDDFGLGIVVYWPRIAYVGDDEKEDK